MCNKTRANLDSLSEMGFIVVFIWPIVLTYFSATGIGRRCCCWSYAQAQSEKMSCSPCLLIAHQSLGASYHQLTSLTYLKYFTHFSISVTFWMNSRGQSWCCVPGRPVVPGLCYERHCEPQPSGVTSLQPAAVCRGWPYLRKRVAQYCCLPSLRCKIQSSRVCHLSYTILRWFKM